MSWNDIVPNVVETDALRLSFLGNKKAIHYPFTGGRGLSIVKKDTDRHRFVHISLRIDEEIRNQLNDEAKRRSITLNSLVNTILSKYLSFDKILEATKAIPLSGSFLDELLEITSTEEMENIGKKLGPKVIRKSFAFRGIAFNLDSLTKFYFEPVSAYSGWYSFNSYFVGTTRILVFEHSRGPKWTTFLKQYVAGIIHSATGTEPEIAVVDETLTFTCK